MDEQRKKICNQTRDDERALYAIHDADVENCVFEGPADGESAMKECKNFSVSKCRFVLRYPLWHGQNYTVKDTHFAPTSRAAVWYGKNGVFENCRMDGVKAFRECDNTVISNCNISSVEAGWKCRDMKIENSAIVSEYLLYEARRLQIVGSTLTGKYFLQYVEDATLENCELQTKDCLWHAKNVTVKNCVLRGEYLGWYSENVTFVNCIIQGTQPLCYCKNLKLEDCRMDDCDFSFERSDVQADIKSRILSVRTPLSGLIVCDGLGALVEDVKDIQGTAKIICRNKM